MDVIRTVFKKDYSVFFYIQLLISYVIFNLIRKGTVAILNHQKSSNLTERGKMSWSSSKIFMFIVVFNYLRKKYDIQREVTK